MIYQNYKCMINLMEKYPVPKDFTQKNIDDYYELKLRKPMKVEDINLSANGDIPPHEMLSSELFSNSDPT